MRVQKQRGLEATREAGFSNLPQMGVDTCLANSVSESLSCGLGRRGVHGKLVLCHRARSHKESLTF